MRHDLVCGLLCAAVLVLVTVSPLCGLEQKALKMREDFSAEPLLDCVLQYYYYIPCPTYAWFWAFSGWEPGEMIGVFFDLRDITMGGWDQCDTISCMELKRFRILDFAGYGVVYPGLCTVEFDVYCSDEHGGPVGPSLWNSGPYETDYSWNYVDVDPAVNLSTCVSPPESTHAAPRILIAATHTGSFGRYPSWGLDNMSTPVELACELHDDGCLPALYPRPHNSHYSTIHTGFYGAEFAYNPPLWFMDGRDTTNDGTMFGYIELAWRIYTLCSEPSTDAATWGSIKAMYR